ncbi:MAG: GIY-YIG nuclease family protein [Planctomycetes bacterium]|nr:GIY-YIG nuclease family protein [Planctomycetota bacterium]
MSFHIYILRCADGTYYIGSTQDLAGREAAHNDGRGAKHTCSRRPVKLVYTESLPTRSAAVRRERQPKRWSRAKKDALIAGDWDQLARLSRARRSPS